MFDSYKTTINKMQVSVVSVYCAFAKKVPVLKKSKMYKTKCSK